MRNIITTTFLLSILAIVGCKKQGEEFNVDKGTFPTNPLTVSVNDLVLTRAIDNDSSVKFNWSPASFGKDLAISYTLQIVSASDTAANGWSHAKSFTVPANNVSFGFLNKDLNAALNTMNLAPGVATAVAARIKADVNQFNGSASTIPSIYSNVLQLQLSAYALALYVPGDYQGWNPGAAPQLAPVPDRAGLFEGYVYMEAAGVHYFKYTNAPDWNHTNYGDGGGGTFSTDGLAAGLSVPDGGYYYLTANLNNNTWTATKVNWGILGDASPGGWNTDTQLTYDPVSQTWKVTADMIQNGSFKFRANNAWALDFGIDNTGKLVYADNPFLGYTPGLNNLTVPSNGNYNITLDLHVPGVYTYTLQKN